MSLSLFLSLFLSLYFSLSLSLSLCLSLSFSVSLFVSLSLSFSLTVSPSLSLSFSLSLFLSLSLSFSLSLSLSRALSPSLSFSLCLSRSLSLSLAAHLSLPRRHRSHPCPHGQCRTRRSVACTKERLCTSKCMPASQIRDGLSGPSCLPMHTCPRHRVESTLSAMTAAHVNLSPSDTSSDMVCLIILIETFQIHVA